MNEKLSIDERAVGEDTPREARGSEQPSRTVFSRTHCGELFNPSRVNQWPHGGIHGCMGGKVNKWKMGRWVDSFMVDGWKINQWTDWIDDS